MNIVEGQLPRNPSLPAVLYKRYGSDMVDAFSRAKVYMYEDVKDQKLDLPDFELAKSILKNSQDFRFIRWFKGPLKPDYMYLTTEDDRRPEGEGNYTTYKGYKYDAGKKRWQQVFTHINAYEDLLLHEKVIDAVSDSDNQAMINALGREMFLSYNQAQYLNPQELDNYPWGSELKRYIKDRRVKIRYMEMDEALESGLSGESATIIDGMGQDFLKSYQDSRVFKETDITQGRIEKPPSYDLMKKMVVDEEAEEIRFVEWVEDGNPQHAYTVKSYYEKDGLEYGQLRVIRPFTNKEGEPDLDTYYYSFNPNRGNDVIRHNGRPFYSLEQETENLNFVQVLTPEAGKKGRFRIVYAGVKDKKTGKCLDFAKVYQSRTFFLTESDLKRSKNVLNHGLKLSQETQNIQANIDGERAVKRNKHRTVNHYTWLATAAIAWVTNIEGMKNVINNPQYDILATALVGIASIIGGINIAHLMDLKAEQLSNIKILVQSARERGVDLADGIPDNELPYFSPLVKKYRSLT